MSSKNFFDKGKSYKVLSSVDPDTLGLDGESYRNIRAQVVDKNRFVPNVDFSSASNFARYGSAKKYYEDAFDRITNEYPYDGSSAEKQEFLNALTYLDLYVFNNLYPTTTGYATLSSDQWGSATIKGTGTGTEDAWGVTDDLEYIRLIGGPNTSSAGMEGKTIHSEFSASNIYDNDIYDSYGVLSLGKQGSRESNLKFDLSRGVTTEFWLKKGSWLGSSVTDKEVIFDLWNGQLSSSADYGRLLIYLTGSSDGNNPIRAHLASGSNVWDISYGGANVLTSSLTNEWQHISLSFKSGSAQLESSFYYNGNLQENKTTTSVGTFGEVTGSLIAHIGGLQTTPSGNVYHGQTMLGGGKLSASLDEFRYWKSERTHEEVSKNYFRNVDGGTNTDLSNTELGVYYKFNEGITTNASTDSTVLDYSGRITNGSWVGYPGVTARNTGSAIVSSSAAQYEQEDPIVYSEHSLVASKRLEMVTSGSAYDYQNNSSIYYTLPTWIIEEDDDRGEINNLTQIIASYFDTLHSQIAEIPRLKDISYLSSSDKPYPFSGRLLESSGLYAPEIFVDASVLEQIRGQSETEFYDKDLTEVKNLIYQNIYNNLVYIYKSKGTEKSFRNVIRCYGVDDELIKVNLYGNNVTHKLRDNFRPSVSKKKHVDFNHPTRFEAVVTHQTASSNANTLDVTYVSGSGTNVGRSRTAEVAVLFPRKLDRGSESYFVTDFLSSSVFGWSRPHTGRGLQDFSSYADAANKSLRLYAVRQSEGSKDVYFALENPEGTLRLTSSVYQDVYDDTNWTFAVKTSPASGSQADDVSGSASTTDVDIELYGCNIELGVIKNEFTTSTTLAVANASYYYSQPRRYYIGAQRADITGSVVTKSDIKASSLRHWESLLTNEEIQAHAKNVDSYGVLRPYESTYLYDTVSQGHHIPKIETLSLNWDFGDVTTSDSDGEFLVNDFSSGSIGKRDRYPSTPLGSALGNQHTGRGFSFPASSADVVSVEYVQVAKQQPPEVVSSYDMTNIMDFDDETFDKDSRTINHFFAIEKSMYQSISEEMLNMFSTIVGFNNLIGEPVNRYRQEYKDLAKLRNLFFERVQNEPDLDKYVDFYRWIDSSLSVILKQLVPASANTSDDVRTIVESHVLERNKYHNKLPTLELKSGKLGGNAILALEAGLEGAHRFIPEEVPNWRYAHAPASNSEADNSVYWQYVGALHPTLSSSDAGVNATREAIIRSKQRARNRRHSAPCKISMQAGIEDKVTTHKTGRRIIHAGVNQPATQRGGAFIDTYSQNYDSSNLTTTTRTNNLPDIDDVLHPMHKKYFSLAATEALDGLKAANYLPFRKISGSLDTGYNDTFNDFQVVNIHSYESYLDGGEIPLQSAFTNTFVGGWASRHTPLQQGSDTKATRAETYHLTEGATGLVFRGPGSSEFGPHNPRDLISRGGKVKRPVNLENLKIVAGSQTLGNYTNIREVVQTAGSRGSTSQFVRNEGVSVADTASTEISGIVDREMLHLTSSGYSMVTRFSAPGGVETSHGGLDVDTSQYSVYSALPYRNLSVRQPLLTLLTASTSQFGFKPGVAAVSASYEGVANFHKINRNTLSRIEYNNEHVGALGTVATASIRDNYFLIRPIPQSDLQYSWLTSSYESTPYGGSRSDGRGMLGYSPRNFEISTSAGYVNAISFVSESHVASDVVVDLAGLNTIIVEPVSSSQQMLGYPLESAIASYETSDFGGISEGNTLNALLSHRGDTYGFNAWNQLRVGQHPVARALRESHLISVEREDTQTYTAEGRVLPRQRYGPKTQYRESPVITKYKPIEQKFQDVIASSTYANNLARFSNQDLNDEDIETGGMVYDKILDLYRDDFAGLKYRETVYPAEKNTYNNKIRTRQGYSIDYWHSDRTTRGTNKADKVSLGGRSLYSVWGLDAKEDFSTADDSKLKAQNNTTSPSGELQNASTQGHFGSKQYITASALYALKHWVATTASTTAPSGISITNAASAAGTGNRIFGFVQVGGGEAEWQTGPMAGRIEDGAYLTSSANRQVPAKDSYEDYAEDLRVRNKDYAIVPEFRISDHIPYYISTNGGDFLAQNTSSLGIFGTSGTEDYPSDSSQEQFYNTYTNSDFLKYFDVVKADHEGIAKEHSITLRCKALKKFLPYNGFYPAERTLQLAEQFSSSYAKHVEYTGADSSYENAKIRPFLETMFSPGIVYNSIKSGLGVSYPVLTASYAVQALGSYYAISSSANGSKFRMLDFEAAVEPEKYLANIPLVDMAPHPSASLNITASWNGRGDPLYSMMAHNFFGEVPEFFLPQGNMTTIVSLPESDPRFGNAVSGSVYNMRIKMFRSMNIARSSSASTFELPQDNPLQSDLRETFTMYSRPSAFFHPVTGRNAITAATDHDGTYHQRMLDSYNGYNWAGTPPYYHGEAWLDIQFTATETRKYTVAEILGSVDGALEFRYDRAGGSHVPGNNAGYYADGTGDTSLRSNIMNLADTIIVDGRTRVKSVTYDPVTGEPISISDDPEANHVAFVIQPKWETPMFNFGNSKVNLENLLTVPTMASESVPRGMWHQFGLPPEAPDQGIFLQVTDIPQDWLNNYPGVGSTYYNNGNVESLVDLFGIDQTPRRLGEVAVSKTVSEAVVAIPYLQKGSEKEFFALPRDLIEQAVANKLEESNSVQQMVNKLQNYILPPRMDFLTCKHVEPFAMYVFEFEHHFDKDDLTHIWQNLPPKSVDRVEEKEATVSHKLLSNELLGREGLPGKLRWMVFKIKKRAVKNYFSKVASRRGDNLDDKRYKFEFKVAGRTKEVDYSYNWPYDFFSLVEMIKLDAEVDFCGDEEQ